MYIAHRINTIAELLKIPKEFGVEIDLRDYNDRLILQHDPFLDGEDFEEYLKVYNKSFIILNIKSERIEYRVLELLKKYNIKNYFFLDSSFPMIYTLKDKNMAIRFSEYEGMDTIRKMAGKINWVWIDCFTKFPLTYEIYSELKELGYKICIVSPELQKHSIDKINEYRSYMLQNNIKVDAICSKIYNNHLWLST